MRSRIPQCIKMGSEGSDIIRDGGGRGVDRGENVYKKKEGTTENGIGLVMPGNR
jgi:hypothetical protein